MRKIIVICLVLGLWFSGIINIIWLPASSEDNSDNRFYYNHVYAVIIVGIYNDEEHYNWYSKDAQRQYNVLTEKYGFSDDDIHVLFTLKEEWDHILNIDPDIIDYNASEENIKIVFNNLADVITEEDLLYVVAISHGGDNHNLLPIISIDFWQGKFAHDTYFGLEETSGLMSDEHTFIHYHNFGKYGNSSIIDDRIYDHELNDYTKDITARRIIFVLQPCLSGGFINDLSKSNHVIITASREVQPAFAPFLGYFYYGLNGSANDYNDDGRISLEEIFKYAAENVYNWIKDNHPRDNGWRLQHPLIDDNGDKVGHRYDSLVGYNSNNSQKDGYVVARIFDFAYEELLV